MNYKNVPVNKRPGFIAAGTYRLYSTPAAMQAFAEAEMDRLDWNHGVAQDQHIPEPPHGRETVRPPAPGASMDLGEWWDIA